MFDLVIRGGDVVNGTGGARYRADVGVLGDRVVAIGTADGDAAIVIDATGKVVTPGFVDVHTHYDAQVFWDGALTPSPLHGVTTALGGNCGFSIAPLSNDPEDSEYLLQMLARVEGMPVASLRCGVPWDWKSSGEYLDGVAGRLGINAGFMVGHSAIRRTVMGPDAVRRAASATELEAMQRALRDGLEAGGLGLSSSWARSHNGADGRMVPSRDATANELLSLCATAGEVPGTSLEFIPMVGVFEQWALELMADMSVAADRWLNWNVLSVAGKTAEAIEGRLAAGDVANARGGRVAALTMPAECANRLTFESGFAYDSIPGWEEPMHEPISERISRFADPRARAELNRLAHQDANPFPELVDWGSHFIFDVVAPENAEYAGRVVGDIANEQGRDPWDVLCDIVVVDELKTSFGSLAPVLSKDDWQRRIEVVRDHRAVLGGSDAGAHVAQLSNFNFPTVVLGDAVRRHEVLSLEEAVHHMTEVPAALYGLKGRGILAEGNFADLVVLDPATIATRTVAMRYDLPGGAGRLFAEADGIDWVIVNGIPVVESGTLTGATAGSLLRSGRDTYTA